MLRLFLEVYAYIAFGFFGFKIITDSILRWGLMLAVPIGFAIIWGFFNVPGDPSRDGKAVFPINGITRLAIEFFYFGFGVIASYLVFDKIATIIYTTFLVGHYVISYDRILWLLRQNFNNSSLKDGS